MRSAISSIEAINEYEDPEAMPTNKPTDAIPPDLHIHQRDDGRYQLGLCDDTPSFETRDFARAVANMPRHLDRPRTITTRRASRADAAASNRRR